MTERERLIKLLDERITIQECSFSPDKPLTTDSLADYLLAHGVCVIPYKPDQPVWLIDKGYVHECRVRRIIPHYGGTHLLELDDKTDRCVLVIELEIVEEYLFFTYEEAINALERKLREVFENHD